MKKMEAKSKVIENCIECCKCGRFIVTESFDEDNKITVTDGNYNNGFYVGEEDSFYCRKCAVKFNKMDPLNAETYYDPECDKYVDKDYIKKQYEWFSSQSWFHKTYEEFLADNFYLDSNMTSIKDV